MSKELNIKLKKLDDRAVIPTYAHVGDVGMDFTAIDITYDAELDMYIYHTGLAFESDFNVGQFLFPRSSNSKKECYLTNSVGIADSAIYRGEIQFRFKLRDSISTIATNAAIDSYMKNTNILGNNFDSFIRDYKTVYNETLERAKNLDFAPYAIGDRIGQMVFMEYPTVKLEVVSELSDSDRGEGGFGSTDEKK